MKRITILLLFLLNFGLANAKETYKPKKIQLSFAIDTRFGLVKGSFKKVGINILDPESGKATVLVDASSIDTGLSMRDNHLRDEDFFDVKKYSKIKFELEGLKPIDMQKIEAYGVLTIKNITKSIKFPVIKTVSGNTEKYVGSLSINRKDYGLNYDSVINPIKDNAMVEFSLSVEVSK